MNLKLGFKWRCVIHSWCLGSRQKVWYWCQVAGVFVKIKLCLSPNRWSWVSHSYTSRYVRVLRLFRNEKSWELNISYRLNMNLIVGRIVVGQCVYNPLDSSPWRTLLYVHDSNVEHEWIFISISIKKLYENDYYHLDVVDDSRVVSGAPCPLQQSLDEKSIEWVSLLNWFNYKMLRFELIKCIMKWMLMNNFHVGMSSAE